MKVEGYYVYYIIYLNIDSFDIGGGVVVQCDVLDDFLSLSSITVS